MNGFGAIAEVAELRESLDAALETVETLRKALGEFGRHDGDCAGASAHLDCYCGWNATRRQLLGRTRYGVFT